jgi:hypothetical protein
MSNPDGGLRWLQGQAPAGTLDAEAWAREVAPDARPTWDFNAAEG